MQTSGLEIKWWRKESPWSQRKCFLVLALSLVDTWSQTSHLASLLSGSWWLTGRPGVLRFMGSQRVRHDWATELNWSLRFNSMKTISPPRTRGVEEIHLLIYCLFSEPICRASLVTHWIRIHLPMQGTQIWSLVQEDPTCHGATKLMSHSYWACKQQLESSPHSPLLEKAHAQQRDPVHPKIKINQ